MEMKALALATALLLFFGAAPDRPAEAVAELKYANGAPVGTVRFVQAPRGLLVIGEVRGLSPGPHGLHVHEVGKCEPPFQSAGGHFNPTGKTHGFLSSSGMHAGDLPNIVVPASGRLQFELFAPDLTLEPGKPGYLLDADGSALLVHSGPDDYRSDPAGGSGDRVACGVVSKL
jgi:Cu-Zn family superoxide dismutase